MSNLKNIDLGFSFSDLRRITRLNKSTQSERIKALQLIPKKIWREKYLSRFQAEVFLKYHDYIQKDSYATAQKFYECYPDLAEKIKTLHSDLNIEPPSQFSSELLNRESAMALNNAKSVNLPEYRTIKRPSNREALVQQFNAANTETTDETVALKNKISALESRVKSLEASNDDLIKINTELHKDLEIQRKTNQKLLQSITNSINNLINQFDSAIEELKKQIVTPQSPEFLANLLLVKALRKK